VSYNREFKLRVHTSNDERRVKKNFKKEVILPRKFRLPFAVGLKRESLQSKYCKDIDKNLPTSASVTCFVFL
jgi:hypothetical protein